MPSTSSAAPYAILSIKGHQVHVEPGTMLTVDRIDAGSGEPGTAVTFTDVLLARDAEGTISIGAPILEGAKVVTEVVEHPRGIKLRVFKMKPKKRYRRTRGHRADYTTLRVTSIEL